jgi:GR25 family glycosyltransferase involved in LPS biosynthesis
MKACVFINLPAAAQRRASVEAAFAQAAHEGWALQRFEALGPEQVAQAPGSLSAAEKGCFASHRAVLAQHLEDEALLFVVEDDAVFSPGAFAVVDAMLARAQDWDLMFTDVAICDIALMVHLARLRDGLVARGEHLAVQLSRRLFYAATAYVVRGPAKRALHALLAEATELDRPYDLYLRDLSQAGRLKLGACFPFVTTLAPEAEESQIQGDDARLLGRTLNAYRRLMYEGRDLAACRAAIAPLRAAVSTEPSRLVGELFSIISAPDFPLER